MEKRKRPLGLGEQLEAMKGEFADDESKPWQVAGKRKPTGPKPLSNWEKTQHFATGAISKAGAVAKKAGKRFLEGPYPERDRAIAKDDSKYQGLNANKFRKGLAKTYNLEAGKDYQRALDEEKKITPDDEEGAAARARRRVAR